MIEKSTKPRVTTGVKKFGKAIGSKFSRKDTVEKAAKTVKDHTSSTSEDQKIKNNEKNEKQAPPASEIELKSFLDRHIGPTEEMTSLWCLKPEAMKPDVAHESQPLGEVELILRQAHASLFDGTRLCSQTETSVRGSLTNLFERPYSQIVALDGIRAEVEQYKGQQVHLNRAAKLYEKLIVQVASLRDPHYGKDLQMVTDLIACRAHLRRAVGVTFRPISTIQILKSSKDISDLISTAYKDSAAWPSIEQELKKFQANCKFLGKDIGNAPNENETNNYRQSLIDFYRGLNAHVPSKMKPASTMNKQERDKWMDLNMQVMVGPLRGLSDEDGLEKAITSIQNGDLPEIKKAALASGSLRMIGLIVQGAVAIAKKLPESENSEVRHAIDQLTVALTEHAGMLKTYSGAENAEAAMESFDAEKYRHAVGTLRPLVVEVFRAAGLADSDATRYIADQTTKKSSTFEKDCQTLRDLLKELK
jgi:hypothetical protein